MGKLAEVNRNETRFRKKNSLYIYKLKMKLKNTAET